MDSLGDLDPSGWIVVFDKAGIASEHGQIIREEFSRARTVSRVRGLTAWDTTAWKSDFGDDKDGAPEFRRLTDCGCLVMFVLMWLLLLVIGWLSVMNGQPERLLFGVDAQGNTCGVGELQDTRRIFYPRQARWHAQRHGTRRATERL